MVTNRSHPIDTIAGERAADRALARIQGGTADPNLLALAISNLLAADGFVVPPSSRFGGFARRIQKVLELSALPGGQSGAEATGR